MTVGSVIKERRISLNIKQEDISEKLGVTVQTYSKWENDKTEPKASQVSKLSQILKVSEKSICQGTLPKKSIDPIKFMRAVSTLQRHMNDIDFIMTLWDHIDDDDELIEALLKSSGLPKEAIGQE